MADASTPQCPNCKRLESRIEALEARLEALEAENARLRKDSSNSHKFTRLWRAALQRHRQAEAAPGAPRQ